VSTPRDDRDLDLDALLRQPTERLAPPDGSWELVARRARRRKWAKASASVAAGLIVLAGAVPAVIAVRHNSDDQTLQIASPKPSHQLTGGPKSPRPIPVVSTASPAVSATSAPPVSLAGFKPVSLSFISPDVGFLVGPGVKSAVVARTTDDGSTWTGLSSVPVDGNNVGIRFANGSYGYVFGKQLYMTSDGGTSWTPEQSPGYIQDLETMKGVVWATVSKCANCRTVQLYEAPVGDPNFQPVTKVGTLPGDDSTLVVSSRAVYVMGQNKNTQQGVLWWSPNGTKWTQRTDPCAGYAMGTFAAWSTNGLAALCDQGPDGSKPAVVRESDNHGKSWTTVATTPDNDPGMITAGSSTSLVVSPFASVGGPLVTARGNSATNSPLHFTSVQTGTPSVGFVGFIDIAHVVAISSPIGSDSAFMTSTDGGLHWSVHTFSG
jgi:hypothetical protein